MALSRCASAPGSRLTSVEDPTFESLCRLLRHLEADANRRPTREQRHAALQTFFARHVPIGCEAVGCVLALLLPTEDTRRYYLKEARLARAVAAALGLQPTAVDLSYPTSLVSSISLKYQAQGSFLSTKRNLRYPSAL